MCLHLTVDVHSGTRTQYHSLQTPWLAVESRTRVSSCLGLVSWMYLHLRVDVRPGTCKYRGIRTVCTYANKRLINFSPKENINGKIQVKQYQVNIPKWLQNQINSNGEIRSQDRQTSSSIAKHLIETGHKVGIKSVFAVLYKSLQGPYTKVY
ncbi:unnamed protein product [Schistosoma curassoni]|uniref:40S ribosomal protein S18 n=1 Tax=Schistosoma curassoni TaxID=6186 RepID=A0A183JY43_9TREM|nr:unnamed protein product [Schistosoma curassoni]